MSYAGFRFTGRFASLLRPGVRPPAVDGDTWARDKVGGVGGTEVDATWVNRVKANLERLVVRLGGNLNDGDDQLANAVGGAIDGRAPAEHDHDELYYRQVTVDEAFALLQPLSQKALPNGYAGLDSAGKVPTAQLPDAVLGAMAFQGVWDAAANNPALASGTGTKGHYFIATTAGASDLDGIDEWAVGDWAVFDGTAWRKVDNTDAIASVAGLTGVITANGLKSALTLGIADVSGLAASLSAKVATADIVNSLSSTDAAKPLSAAQGKVLKDLVDGLTGGSIWASQPIGVPIPVSTDLFATLADALPPTDNPAYRYVLLTAGEDGDGEYNHGILVAESVSGSAPLVTATAVIDLDGSPLDGKTVHLLNTERRGLRAGSPGVVQNDQMQQITGSFTTRNAVASLVTGAFTNGGESGLGASDAATSGFRGYLFNSANSPGARAGSETRTKNIGVTYVMRIK